MVLVRKTSFKDGYILSRSTNGSRYDSRLLLNVYPTSYGLLEKFVYSIDVRAYMSWANGVSSELRHKYSPVTLVVSNLQARRIRREFKEFNCAQVLILLQLLVNIESSGVEGVA